jgi:hypothetical protein
LIYTEIFIHGSNAGREEKRREEKRRRKENLSNISYGFNSKTAMEAQPISTNKPQTDKNKNELLLSQFHL